MIITLNAVLCLLIAVRLFTFDREHYQYKAKYSWLAWLMITSSAAVFMFSFFGLPNRAYCAQVVMNLTLLLCFINSKGNIGTLCRSPNKYRHDKGLNK
ncbi:phage holin family protein [Gilliamella sp. B2865]|uniref:phage holin family protein n=1 Tax=Gilliamella sp. B2865 TaxID=2817984 RepID=UPI003A5CF053|nr:phage holin family protein [Gilliamella sp. B2865]